MTSALFTRLTGASLFVLMACSTATVAQDDRCTTWVVNEPDVELNADFLSNFNRAGNLVTIGKFPNAQNLLDSMMRGENVSGYEKALVLQQKSNIAFQQNNPALAEATLAKILTYKDEIDSNTRSTTLMNLVKLNRLLKRREAWQAYLGEWVTYLDQECLGDDITSDEATFAAEMLYEKRDYKNTVIMANHALAGVRQLSFQERSKLTGKLYSLIADAEAKSR